MKNKKKEFYGQVDENPAAHATHLIQMQNYYAKTAEDYNSMHCNPTDVSPHNYAVNEILRTLRNTNSRTLLDVCCGTGRALKAALDDGYEATGIDASAQLLEIGKKEMGIPENRLILGDATSLPFPDQAFDVTCVLGALHHTAMPTKLVSEMIRVTKTAMIISDEGNHIPGGIKQILVELGIFNPLYRLLFRREPRQNRRLGVTEGDGPAFVFSIEEIIPMLKNHFVDFKCLTFYRFGNFQYCSYRVPRLFARNGVITVTTRKS